MKMAVQSARRETTRSRKAELRPSRTLCDEGHQKYRGQDDGQEGLVR
jgi:hypothetical protein